MKYVFCLVLAFFVVVASFRGSAQQVADTSFRQAAVQNLIQFYYVSIDNQAHLYNGPLYDAYPQPFTEGHPYFLADSFYTGSVSYDGLEYVDVPLKYDLIRDELVMLHFRSGSQINLIKEKIDSFSITGHSFIKIEQDSSSINFPGTSFYDQLYSSPAIKYLVKREKNIQEMTERNSIETKVYARTDYYILKNGRYHTVKNKNSLLNVLRDKKNQLQEFIKKNGFRFKANFEAEVLRVVQYYDHSM